MDDKGRCSQCFAAEGPVKFLLYSEGRDMIVVVTEGLILSQLRVAHDGTTSEVAKVRDVNKCLHQGLCPQKRPWLIHLSSFDLFSLLCIISQIWNYYYRTSCVLLLLRSVMIVFLRDANPVLEPGFSSCDNKWSYNYCSKVIVWYIGIWC